MIPPELVDAGGTSGCMSIMVPPWHPRVGMVVVGEGGGGGWACRPIHPSQRCARSGHAVGVRSKAVWGVVYVDVVMCDHV